jgi:D-alanyl-D-alanine carboxypeptidase
VNTHFTNTNGIHDENHYSTANDLAIIAKYCMQNSSFRTIVSMSSCTIPATNKSEERNFVNTNDLILDSSEYYRKDCIGIKTGYTSQAKNCLISACSDGNIELISVILGSNSLSDRYADANTLFDYGYEIHDSIAQIEADTDTKIENEDSSVDQNFLNNDITTSPLSTKDLFSQSFFEYLVQSDILIIILRVLLILIILAILAIFLTKKLREEKVEKQL